MTTKLREQAPGNFHPELREAPASIAELAGRYRAALNGYFRRRIRNREEAEDLTQEVFLHVARRGHSRAINGAFLFQVARNLVRDRWRAAKVRSGYYAGACEQQDSAEELSPERVTIARENLRDVVAALKLLNRRTCDIFILHRFENLKYHEIAKLYGISQSAVEKHIMKALACLTDDTDLP